MSTLYRCPSCGHNESKVLNVRMNPSNDFGIVRARVCSGCGHKYRTYELDPENQRIQGDLFQRQYIDGHFQPTVSG